MKESWPKLSWVLPLSPRLPLIRYWPSEGTSRLATAPPEPIDWLRVVSSSPVPSFVVGSLRARARRRRATTWKRSGAERRRGSLLSSPAVGGLVHEHLHRALGQGHDAAARQRHLAVLGAVVAEQGGEDDAAAASTRSLGMRR